MTRRLVFRGVVLFLVFVAWLSTVVAPAMAAPTPALLVSSDGTHWAVDLGTPLFDPAVLWVPGDARSSAFYVQNQGTTPASVSLQVRTESEANLIGEGDVELQARAQGDQWHSVMPTSRRAVLNALAIPIDGARRIDVRAVFRRGSHNVSQSSAAVLRFVVQLGEAVVGTPEPGSLPLTGAPALGLPLLLAAACLGSGAALVRRRGRA